MSLHKLFLGLVAGAATFAASAQATDAPSAMSAPDTPPKVAPVDPVLGIIKEKTESADRASDFCRLDSSMTLPSSSMVVVVRKAPCISRYGASYSKDFLEVLYAGKTRLVPADAVFMTDKDAELLETLEPAQVEASANVWRLVSLRSRVRQLETAMKALDATGKRGVALLKASIFDVSQYTEGTGFEATVYNSTKKTIKYVTFTVVGRNAVGDPVRAGFRGNAASMLRGIGPIAPGETASYSKDYMWMTDVVESFRISSIKLEYTDGSSKVVSDVKSIRISERDYDALEASND